MNRANPRKYSILPSAGSPGKLTSAGGEKVMQAHRIVEKAKILTDSKGKPREVVLPYQAYQELVRLKISQEIYERAETQQAIGSARRDIAAGRVRRFRNLAEALKWLEE